jgi:superfamily II DNA or RNA helicase/diadenosine tetraphosphate (Ap4A) HIT family hydrolase
MTEPGCPFCQPSVERIAFVDELVFALWDAFPVSPGHLLVIPRRHFPTWFEATPEEHAALVEGIHRGRAAIEGRHRSDGFNIGVNIGLAAGQTVPHLHVHLIPRTLGDVPNPRGGVRHIIPGKGDYLTPPPARQTPPRLVTGGEDDPLLPYLTEQFANARLADIAVGFVQPSGMTRIEPHFRDFLARGGRLRLVTGDYLGITHPDALMRLLDLEGDRDIRVFETQQPPKPEWPGPSPAISFHPKSYLFRAADGSGVAFVGSSNLTESALTAGIEWNYRVVSSQEGTPFADLVAAFERLFRHSATRRLDQAWIDEYRGRRPAVSLPSSAAVTHVDVASEVEPPPTPHGVQLEALDALRATRTAGNTAGLVVLATGLGKTWLSAFDSHRPEFGRILFVAHREEILGQAMRTFRRVRPTARLGLYTGEEKDPGAAILFASIQTMGRNQHLERFSRTEFDYIVVDEFHHAAAATYRRLIDYFRPRFLLGLTATPDRTDGGDLLALCQENLVYECGLVAGLKRDLLCKFTYVGVPDDVDYSNIPWRSTGFDENELTARLAVDTRAANALEQLEKHKHGGNRSRMLVFCVSQRHADFMAAYMNAHGHPSVAVHSGSTSAPRAQSLERLRSGDLDAICAVDVFNEGLDLPELDTVLMLRPTESRILFLQQLGRGLRKTPEGKVLSVIDYIGNHRAFLLKPRALFDLGTGDQEVFDLIEKFAKAPNRQVEIAPGCFVTYDLKAIDILRGLLRATRSASAALERYYLDFQELHGQRPTAAETFHDGYDPGLPRSKRSHWFGFVKDMGGLAADQAIVAERHRPWLEALEATDMTRSYKILVLLTMLNRDAFPGAIAIEDLVEGVDELASRNPRLRAEIGARTGLRTMLERSPIEAWKGGRGTGEVRYFSYHGGQFRTTFEVDAADRVGLQEMTRELADWRLSQYLWRTEPSGAPLIGRVTHQAGKLSVTVGNTDDAWPANGPASIAIDGITYEARIDAGAIDVLSRPGETTNELLGLLRGWFGPDAGMPGTNHQVSLHQERSGVWSMKPSGTLKLWRAYSREQIPPMFGLDFSQAIWNVGFVRSGEHTFLLVTLDKGQHSEDFQYQDKFLSATMFQWQSQNRHRRESETGRSLERHAERGIKVHLFVRSHKRDRSGVGRFYYCGDVAFQDWERDEPITVRWKLPEPVPDRLHREWQVPSV